MIRSILLFLFFIGIIIITGRYTGFWSDIHPHLFDKSGPGGLSSNFGTGLVTEFSSIIFQIFITIGIFKLVAGAENRKNKKQAKLYIGKKLVGVYMHLLTKEKNVHWENLSKRLP